MTIVPLSVVQTLSSRDVYDPCSEQKVNYLIGGNPGGDLTSLAEQRPDLYLIT